MQASTFGSPQIENCMVLPKKICEWEKESLMMKTQMIQKVV